MELRTEPAIAQRISASLAGRARLLLLVALCAFAFALRFNFGPLVTDDAYITFRYARNAAQGLGPVYNPGERVLGVTTPLWMLLNTGAALLGWDLPTFSFLAGSLFDSLVPPLLFCIGLRLGWSAPFATVPALAYAINPFVLCVAISSMETGLFMAFLAAAAWATLAGRPHLSSLAASLAALTRPEGFVLLAALLARELWAQRRLRWRTIAIPLALLGPWALFATLFYGSPVPNSALAKASVYRDFSFASQVMLYYLGLVTIGLPTLLPTLFLDWTSRWPFVLGALVLPGLSLLKAGGLWPPLALHLGLGLATAAAILAGRLLFAWYLVPLMLAALLGTAHLVRRTMPPHIAAAAAVIVLLGSPVLLSWSQTDSDAFLPSVTARLGREPAYWQAVERLASEVTPETTVATNEIGVIGFGLPARVLDTLGLVSPESPPYHRGLRAGQDIPFALIEDRRPDYIIAHEAALVRSWGSLERAFPTYELIATFPAPPMDTYERVLVLKRRP